MYTAGKPGEKYFFSFRFVSLFRSAVFFTFLLYIEFVFILALIFRFGAYLGKLKKLMDGECGGGILGN